MAIHLPKYVVKIAGVEFTYHATLEAAERKATALRKHGAAVTVERYRIF